MWGHTRPFMAFSVLFYLNVGVIEIQTNTSPLKIAKHKAHWVKWRMKINSAESGALDKIRDVSYVVVITHAP